MSHSTIADNRRARFEYDISETFEGGLVLKGAEIKAIRAGRVDLSAVYVRIIADEAWLINMNISAGVATVESTRTRKVLLHKHEIARLIGLGEQKGYALVPLRLYIHKGKAKLEIGVGQGRKLHDKRDVIKQRDMERELRKSTRQ